MARSAGSVRARGEAAADGTDCEPRGLAGREGANILQMHEAYAKLFIGSNETAAFFSLYVTPQSRCERSQQLLL